MQKSKSRYAGLGYSLVMGVLVGVGAAVIFAAGFFFRDLVGMQSVFAAPFTTSTTENSYPLLDEVQTIIDQHYLRDQPEYTQRQYSAIRGMLVSLEDRYTFFIDPPVAQSESDVLAGTYGGIGVELRRNEQGDFVLYPYKDSPAAAAGITDGDILQAVNGTFVDLSLQQDALDQMLRGEVKEGNGVEITVLQADDSELTVFIPFAVINVPSVLWRVLDDASNVGYVEILRFTSRTPEELQTALTDLNDAEVDGLILDLRNNAGGLLQESIDVASQFLTEDEVVLYERDKDNERTFNARGGALAPEIPMVVIVNRGTASAAELVAGAIRDNERGILVGQKTYGKGTVQQIFRLSDESSLHVTSAEWLTPSRAPLDGTGLEPDIAMIPDPNGRDVELGEALRQLQQQLVEDTENG
jgi:carboxyl-terminal processing protease